MTKAVDCLPGRSVEVKETCSSNSPVPTNVRMDKTSKNRFHSDIIEIVEMLVLELLAAVIIIFVLPVIVVIFSRKHITKTIGYSLC
jgi:hypothetical protein